MYLLFVLAQYLLQMNAVPVQELEADFPALSIMDSILPQPTKYCRASPKNSTNCRKILKPKDRQKDLEFILAYKAAAAQKPKGSWA